MMFRIRVEKVRDLLNQYQDMDNIQNSSQSIAVHSACTSPSPFLPPSLDTGSGESSKSYRVIFAFIKRYTNDVWVSVACYFSLSSSQQFSKKMTSEVEECGEVKRGVFGWEKEWRWS